MGVWKKLIEQGGNRRVAGNDKPEIFLGSALDSGSDTDFMVIVEQNAEVQKWVPKVRRALRQSARWFTDGKDSFVMRPGRGEKKLAQSIGSYTKKDHGEINKIAFTMERHGVFVHKGVGRGYNARGNGFVIRTAKGPMEHQRVAVEWFNPILDQLIPELADSIAKVNADASINASRMKIN